jgi:hypothetical protein
MNLDYVRNEISRMRVEIRRQQMLRRAGIGRIVTCEDASKGG